ncbi:MAG: phosphohydrolase, partial [Ekhidna sp.]
LMATPALSIFLEQDVTAKDFEDDADILEVYSLLDDNDIWGSLKFWQEHDDFVLRNLSQMLLGRRLFGIHFANDPVDKSEIDECMTKVIKHFNISPHEASFFAKEGVVSNSAYVVSGQSINILMKSGAVVDVVDATDLPNIKAMSKIVKKHYLCAPKSIYS